MSLAQSTLWSQDSLASPSPARVSAEVRLMLAGSGAKYPGSFDPRGPLGVSLKMFLGLSVWDSMTYSAIWSARATKRRRVYIRLRRLGRRTNGNGSSSSGALWLTPRHEGFDAGGHRGATDSLHSQVKQMWPTPASADGDRTSETYKRGNPTLRGAALWPTPAAQAPACTIEQWRKANERADHVGMPLPTAVSTVAQGKLNPAWVTQLMGFPDGWLDIEDSLSSPTAGPRVPAKRSTHLSRRARSRPATEHPDAPQS